MKKIMYLAAALLVLVGCNKNSQENKENAPANYGTITGKIELPQTPNKIVAPDGWKAMTEAFTMQWESTDKIYIYNQSECKELTVKSIDEQTGNATFEGELLTDMSSYNVAYGYNPKEPATAFTVSYKEGNYRPYAWGDGEKNNFWINNFGPVLGLRLKGNVALTKIEVVTSKETTAKDTYTMDLSANPVTLDETSVTMVYFPLNNLGDADHLEAKFHNASGVKKTQAFATLPVINVVTSYPTIEGIYDPYNGHEYVDLGLPSGLKWATMNVGATEPEESGYYFAWGETGPKATYDEGTYTYTDNPTTLPLDHDAANVNWGGNWRMPTKAEQDELRNNCTWTPTQKNGINGYEVKGTNGNTIFLPASGYRNYSSLVRFGYDGIYWSSSISEDFSFYAYLLICYYQDNTVDWEYNYRILGMSVRPVCE